jgi:hypothetical protein
MGETTEPGSEEAELAADRLEAALARIASGLAKPALAADPAPAAGPDNTLLAGRLDALIERVRAELAAAQTD